MFSNKCTDGNEIYIIDNKRYNIDTNVQERVFKAECNINELINHIDQLTYEIKMLQRQFEEAFSNKRAALDEKTVNSNKKCDLEILEENGEFRLGTLYQIDDEY